MKRADLMRRMHKAGLRLDDAATAASIAMNCLRHARDDLMERVRGAGLSYRQIATVFDLDVALVHRVLTAGKQKSTGNAPTVKPSKTSEA